MLLCSDAFEICMKGFARKIGAARASNQTILRPFRYSTSSWRNSAAVLQQELIDLSQQWNTLGLSRSCPYKPTETALLEQAKRYEDFEMVQKLRASLVRALDSNSDGRAPAEEW